jgi:uncharacterized coiled-coil protein SlyX
MRRPVQILLYLVMAVLLGAIVVSYQRYRKAAADYISLRAEDQATRSRYDEAIAEMAAIQDSLDAIVVKGSGAPLASSELEVERKLNETGGDRALARIAVIKAGLERAKTRIQQLDARLARSGIKMAGLEKMVANLNQSVAEKEAMVAQLTSQVDTLQNRVSGLSSQVEDQAATIETKRREAGTVYYVIGSKKSLTDSGIIEAKGGVLGMGKTLRPTGKVASDRFTELDTDQSDTIHIPAAKVQVVSAQPPTSYELLPAGKEMDLHILNAQEFRRVKQVVIVTT